MPASAEGTEALFDALTALPGVDMEAAIRASRGRPKARLVIWRRRAEAGVALGVPNREIVYRSLRGAIPLSLSISWLQSTNPDF